MGLGAVAGAAELFAVVEEGAVVVVVLRSGAGQQTNKQTRGNSFPVLQLALYPCNRGSLQRPRSNAVPEFFPVVAQVFCNIKPFRADVGVAHEVSARCGSARRDEVIQCHQFVLTGYAEKHRK